MYFKYVFQLLVFQLLHNTGSDGLTRLSFTLIALLLYVRINDDAEQPEKHPRMERGNRLTEISHSLVSVAWCVNLPLCYVVYLSCQFNRLKANAYVRRYGHKISSIYDL